MEDEINKQAEEVVTREGKSYLNNYPVLNNITYYSYRVIIPVIYLTIIVVKLCLEYNIQTTRVGMLFQAIMGTLCGIVNSAFLVENIVQIVKGIRSRFIEENTVKITKM